MKSLLLLLLAPLTALAGPIDKSAASIVTIEGDDMIFAELLENGTLKAGERFFKGNVPGSRVRVHHELLEKQAGAPGPIPKNIRIHTQASGGIQRKDFPNWTRWYQEDGNVQVFRLFQSISFRWGMYVGSKKAQTVSNDGLLLVTGVTVR